MDGNQEFTGIVDYTKGSGCLSETKKLQKFCYPAVNASLFAVLGMKSDYPLTLGASFPFDYTWNHEVEHYDPEEEELMKRRLSLRRLLEHADYQQEDCGFLDLAPPEPPEGMLGMFLAMAAAILPEELMMKRSYKLCGSDDYIDSQIKEELQDLPHCTAVIDQQKFLLHLTENPEDLPGRGDASNPQFQRYVERLRCTRAHAHARAHTHTCDHTERVYAKRPTSPALKTKQEPWRCTHTHTQYFVSTHAHSHAHTANFLLFPLPHSRLLLA
jgi:hypothetical protein